MSEQLATDNVAKTEPDIREIVRQAIQEYVHAEQRKAEPAYKTELQDERKRREQLEGRMNQLVEENKKARSLAEEADRNSQIRSELQRLGVAKVDLAFRAVKDEIVRAEDGRLQARGPDAKSLPEISVQLRAGKPGVASGQDPRWKRRASAPQKRGPRRTGWRRNGQDQTGNEQRGS